MTWHRVLFLSTLEAIKVFLLAGAAALPPKAGWRLKEPLSRGGRF